MEKNSTVKLIMAFALLMIGIGLLTTIASSTTSVTTKTPSGSELVTITTARLAGNNINESKQFTVTNAPTDWKQNDCPLTLTSYGNASTTFTETTDYVFTTSTGILTLKNTTKTVQSLPNATYVSYSYCPTGYITSSFGRTIQNLVPGFFALALLITAVALFYSVAKDEGFSF